MFLIDIICDNIMRDKVHTEKGGMLMVVSYWKKNKKMYKKELDIYAHGL